MKLIIWSLVLLALNPALAEIAEPLCGKTKGFSYNKDTNKRPYKLSGFWLKQNTEDIRITYGNSPELIDAIDVLASKGSIFLCIDDYELVDKKYAEKIRVYAKVKKHRIWVKGDLVEVKVTEEPKNKDYEITTDKYGTPYVYIEGLKKDLFQKYVIKKSRGPKWGADIGLLEDAVDEDFYERHTYWSESGYPEAGCPSFTEEDFENAFEIDYGLSWEAIKKVNGSKKTVYYLGSYTITIESGAKMCTYSQTPDDRYVFLNKLEDGKPVYLGHLKTEAL